MPNESLLEFNSKLKELSTNNPNYSIGELLYSILQPKACETGNTVSFLLNLPDMEAFNMVDASIKRELIK